MIEAMKTFTDYEFIVKCDEDDDVFRNQSAQAKNIHTFGWIPQKSLESKYHSNPNIRLFTYFFSPSQSHVTCYSWWV